MADIVLSQGRSSRLYQSLIYQQQVAQNANANADLREDNGLFQLTAIVAAGRKPEDAEASLRAEIKKLQDTPVPAAELEKAKNQIITSELRQRETNLGKAQALGGAAVLLGDPNRVNTDLDKLQAVTAADIQRVAQKYFTDQNRYVLYYLPESQRPASGAPASSLNEACNRHESTSAYAGSNRNSVVRDRCLRTSTAGHSSASHRAAHGSVSEAGRDDSAKWFTCGRSETVGHATDQCAALNQKRRGSRSCRCCGRRGHDRSITYQGNDDAQRYPDSRSHRSVGWFYQL